MSERPGPRCCSGLLLVSLQLADDILQKVSLPKHVGFLGIQQNWAVGAFPNPGLQGVVADACPCVPCRKKLPPPLYHFLRFFLGKGLRLRRSKRQEKVSKRVFLAGARDDAPSSSTSPLVLGGGRHPSAAPPPRPPPEPAAAKAKVGAGPNLRARLARFPAAPAVGRSAGAAWSW